MPVIPRISESEWRVMKVLWERSPLTAGEIVEVLVPQTRWKAKTVKTLLNRLVSKGALGFDRAGRAYRYYPQVSERECVLEESRSFLQRVYGGTLLPMVAALIEEQELSAGEIQDLKRILDRNERAK